MEVVSLTCSQPAYCPVVTVIFRICAHDLFLYIAITYIQTVQTCIFRYKFQDRCISRFHLQCNLLSDLYFLHVIPGIRFQIEAHLIIFHIHINGTASISQPFYVFFIDLSSRRICFTICNGLTASVCIEGLHLEPFQ